jgi:hypothetical protein
MLGGNNEMMEFNAYFYGSKLYINGKKEYTLGEILTKYLSKKFKDLEDTLHECKYYANNLHYPEDESEAKTCNIFMQEAIVFFGKMDDLIYSLPPYNTFSRGENRLFCLLNEATWLFDNEPDLKEWDEYERRHPEYNDYFYTTLPLNEIKDADLIDGILKFNDKLKAFAQEYVTFVEDLIRVKKVYEPFLKQLHSQSKYLDNAETAKVVADFLEATNDKIHDYEKLKPSGAMTVSYTVLMPCEAQQNKNPVLCENYHFTTIGGFLYIELFKGMELHYLPKICGYCDRYFLLEAGIFSDYCTRPVKGMEDKVCRDLGHRKKYADKVKNDPIWLAYVRAYKQHYARYLKKRITQAEFQEWADFALELRQKAIDGDIGLEEFIREIRK